jgi:hypothetical protein
MLLKKRYGRPLSALSLSLALAFAPLFNVQAEEPEVVPGQLRDAWRALVALAQSDGQSPAVAKLAGEQPLSMERRQTVAPRSRRCCRPAINPSL